ncbi:MAG: hypothetical protein FJW14_12190 [Acidimicrobiia bacterium]|nr:hypothetical protein [Acidimicrobiia bacterium]
MRILVAAAAGLLLLLAVIATPVRAHDPVDINVSYNKEVIRILQRKCEPCHGSGGLSVPLAAYPDVRAWGRAIREEIVERRMPPAIVARGYGQYESDPSLNAREMETLLVWLDGGMPRGDQADLPPVIDASHAHHHSPGPAPATIALPPQTVPAGEHLVVRRVTVRAGAAAGKTIARVQLLPGNSRVLRGARVFAGNQWIGSWLPWQHVMAPPTTHAFQLPARGDVTVELYYRGADAPQVDASTLELTFAAAEARGRLGDIVVEAATVKTGAARGSVQIKQPASVWALYPALDSSVTSMELRVERPDESTEVLMWIPQLRAEWPLSLVMREPVELPAGSVVSLVAESAGASAPRVTLSVMRSPTTPRP